MSDDDKIYVDAEQPATLNNGTGKEPITARCERR